MPLRRRLAILLATGLLCANPAPAPAADNAAAFLDAMRSAGHYDLTLEYLDTLQEDPTLTAETRSRIPYERAITRLEQAQALTSQQARDAAVDAARSELEALIAADTPPRLAAEATASLAGAMVNGATRRLAAASGLSKDDRSAAAAEARQAIEQARSYYATAEEFYTKALEPLTSVQPGSPEADLRLRLRFQLAQARLANTRSQVETANTYGEGSPEHDELLRDAAEQFAALYEKYDTAQSAGVGFYAHLYEGRCYLALGQHRLADGCFEVIASLPADDPGLRRLVTNAQTSLVQSLTEQGRAADALERGTDWLDSLSRGEQAEPQSLALKHRLGVAAAAAAQDADRQDARELLARARGYFQDASRGFNEFQADARMRLLELSGSDESAPTDAATFEEAYQVGVNAMSMAYAARLAESAGQPAVGGDAGRADQAKAAFRQALSLANAETPVDRINDARNKLAYLYWEEQDYLRCAVLAEFVATKHPSDPAAESAAKLAMASFEKLRANDEAAGLAGGFATEHLTQVCQFITRRWAGQPLADSAFGVLVAEAIRNDRLGDARAVLQDVAPERRAPLALRLALATWEQAARGDDAPARHDAARNLEDAVQAVRDERPVTALAATAALFLAQARLANGDAEGALQILEDPAIGPLTLIRSNAATAIGGPGFKAEAYRTALQTYLSVTPPGATEAQAMMANLDKEVTDKAALTRVYFALGVQLQRQIEALSNAGRTDDAERVGGVFAEFVTRLGDAAEGSDWTTRQWTAQTYLKLADSLPGGDQQSTEFYARARDAFEQLLEQAERDPSSAPSENAVLATRMQLGSALRGLGAHEQAVEVFADLLSKRETMLDVQKLAAYTLQDWGQAGGVDHLEESIRGTRKSAETGDNVIWGWSKLASVSGRVAQTRPEYRDLYFEAWLNVATSRFLIGMNASGAQRDTQFASARQTIRLLAQQYPDLGGPERKAEFDTLLKKIQRAEGDEPRGLAEYASANG